MIKENGEKIDSAEIHKIETEIQSLRNALNGDDVNIIKNAKGQLEQVSQSFAPKLYQQNGESEGQSNNGGQSNFHEENSTPGNQANSENKNDDNVYDADYEIVDEDDDDDEKKAS